MMNQSFILCINQDVLFNIYESVHIWRQQPRGRGFENADKGARGSNPCGRQQKYLNFGKNCFNSSGPITA